MGSYVGKRLFLLGQGNPNLNVRTSHPSSPTQAIPIATGIATIEVGGQKNPTASSSRLIS
ncbi:hypothetical protein [Coleofasciculus sp. H7-2]|uniref:hypothetical protein n=1 Tax=Coleofasciculus sp. H7-2 TaxID=3351545 RepID=UPI00366AF2F4